MVCQLPVGLRFCLESNLFSLRAKIQSGASPWSQFRPAGFSLRFGCFEMKKIAGSENIENFVRNNYIYVDKTQYIYDLIDKYERVFFSRPRRFGKSLTLNIIGTLFEKGIDPYFKGTYVEHHWTYGRYPVLQLSFLGYSATRVFDLANQKIPHDPMPELGSSYFSFSF